MQGGPLDYFSMLTGREFSRHNPEMRMLASHSALMAWKCGGLCSPRVFIKMEIEPHSEIFGILLFKISI
jgi:hypothetical protein